MAVRGFIGLGICSDLNMVEALKKSNVTSYRTRTRPVNERGIVLLSSFKFEFGTIGSETIRIALSRPVICLAAGAEWPLGLQVFVFCIKKRPPLPKKGGLASISLT